MPEWQKITTLTPPPSGINLNMLCGWKRQKAPTGACAFDICARYLVCDAPHRVERRRHDCPEDNTGLRLKGITQLAALDEAQMDHSRRELCFLLPALLAFKDQGPSGGALPSKVYAFGRLPTQTSAGNEFRPVLDGTTHDGFHVELHETDLAPGAMPHPPHHHGHEEIFLVREGTLLVTVSGRESTIGAGGVAYISSGEEHGIRNAGTSHAKYFVLALGSDQRRVSP
jgi:quercetin dioxygenase-like cupin family protein